MKMRSIIGSICECVSPTVRNRLTKANLEKYGIGAQVQEALPQIQSLAKERGLQVVLREYKGDILKFDVKAKKFLGSLFGSKNHCEGYGLPGIPYFQIKNSQDIVNSCGKAINFAV